MAFNLFILSHGFDLSQSFISCRILVSYWGLVRECRLLYLLIVTYFQIISSNASGCPWIMRSAAANIASLASSRPNSLAATLNFPSHVSCARAKRAILALISSPKKNAVCSIPGLILATKKWSINPSSPRRCIIRRALTKLYERGVLKSSAAALSLSSVISGATAAGTGSPTISSPCVR